MARLLWYLAIAACIGALLIGASYVAAYSAVGTMLGAPPPKMGKRSQELLWKGDPELPGRPRVWKFTFGPTMIPGARTVTIRIDLMGKVVQVDPSDLRGRLAGFHDRGI